MKAVALCVLALGACSAVYGSDNEEAAAVESIFSGAENIDWAQFSPDALGMQLNYDEMSLEQLQEVADAFARLGLIAPEETDDFVQALQDPRMRRMIKGVTSKWPETMQRVMKDPKYMAFLQEFRNGFDEQALAKIVGLKGGLGTAAQQLQDASSQEN